MRYRAGESGDSLPQDLIVGDTLVADRTRVEIADQDRASYLNFV
jgi:hypothetical protein